MLSYIIIGAIGGIAFFFVKKLLNAVVAGFVAIVLIMGMLYFVNNNMVEPIRFNITNDVTIGLTRTSKVTVEIKEKEVLKMDIPSIKEIRIKDSEVTENGEKKVKKLLSIEHYEDGELKQFEYDITSINEDGLSKFSNMIKNVRMFQKTLTTNIKMEGN